MLCFSYPATGAIMTEKHSNTSTALLVIDVQASFPARPYWQNEESVPYLAEQNRLIAACVERGVPIIRIFHVEPTGAFSIAEGLVKPLDGLIAFEAAFTLHKHAHSAFAGTRLASWLIANGINRIIVSGIRTEQCCETTTRCASDLGFAVDYVTAATLTFPMKHRSGRIFSSEEIKMRTELVLEGRFAHVVSVDEALQRTSSTPLKEVASLVSASSKIQLNATLRHHHR
jgi:nicotinamidase-related amidase